MAWPKDAGSPPIHLARQAIPGLPLRIPQSATAQASPMVQVELAAQAADALHMLAQAMHAALARVPGSSLMRPLTSMGGLAEPAAPVAPPVPTKLPPVPTEPASPVLPAAPVPPNPGVPPVPTFTEPPVPNPLPANFVAPATPEPPTPALTSPATPPPGPVPMDVPPAPVVSAVVPLAPEVTVDPGSPNRSSSCSGVRPPQSKTTIAATNPKPRIPSRSIEAPSAESLERRLQKDTTFLAPL